MKISDYMPKLYKNNLEMNYIINSEEIEFESYIKPLIEKAFNDSILKNASEDGIVKYEKLLDIKLDDNKDNLEYRRARILSKLSSSGILSYNWLKNNLTQLVGEDNYKLVVDNNNYSISMNIADIFINTAATLYNIYRPLVPANMILTVNLMSSIKGNMYMKGIINEAERTYIRGEVRN